MADQPLTTSLRAVLNDASLSLPVHPAVAGRTAELLNSGSAGAEQLIALAGTDPVLAGNLLRAANSAYYAGLPKAGSLDEVLSRIGYEAAGRVMETACRNGLPPSQAQLAAHYLPSLWQHSLGCALGARWLADRCGYPGLAAAAHLAGLLHDLGKWLLLAGFARLPLASRVGCGPSDQLATEILASMHVELGLQLVAEWHLPDQLAGAIGRHHQAELDGEDLVVVLVRLANLGCRKVGLGWQCDPGLVLPTTAEAQFLGLDELALAEYEIMLEDRFSLPAANGPLSG